MRKIIRVNPVENLKLEVTYDNGYMRTYDISYLVHKGSVFAHLEDPEQFKKVFIGEQGSSIEWPGQLDLCADAIWLKAATEEQKSLERQQSISSIYHSDPEIMSGTPVFYGTRVPIKTLFDHLEGGDSLDVFLDDFPTVSREQAIAVLEFAQEMLLHHISSTETRTN